MPEAVQVVQESERIARLFVLFADDFRIVKARFRKKRSIFAVLSCEWVCP
jgi:hypothetical protein